MRSNSLLKPFDSFSVALVVAQECQSLVLPAVSSSLVSEGLSDSQLIRQYFVSTAILSF